MWLTCSDHTFKGYQWDCVTAQTSFRNRCPINDVLCITKDRFQDHLEKLCKVLSHLTKAGLQVNLKKSFIANTELKYLGYWITCGGIKPLTKKIDAIQKLAPPKTRGKL